MVRLRWRQKRTYAGLGLVLSLLLIAGAGGAIWAVGPSHQEPPVVESPAVPHSEATYHDAIYPKAAHPKQTDKEHEPAVETKTPKARDSAGAKRIEGRRR